SPSPGATRVPRKDCCADEPAYEEEAEHDERDGGPEAAGTHCPDRPDHRQHDQQGARPTTARRVSPPAAMSVRALNRILPWALVRQVGDEGPQLVPVARRVDRREPLVALVEREPPLTDGVADDRGELLPLGVRRPDPSRHR